jgi:hypothetical protein
MYILVGKGSKYGKGNSLTQMGGPFEGMKNESIIHGQPSR